MDASVDRAPIGGATPVLTRSLRSVPVNPDVPSIEAGAADVAVDAAPPIGPL